MLACYPTTTRPAFSPLPTASTFEIELLVPQATRAVALALNADSIPVRRTEAKDGWLESDWFDASTLKATSQRILGTGVVKVRAFVDPSRPNHSNITIEVVYHPLADPSRPERELEQQVPSDHPIFGKIVLLTTQLVKQYGAPPDSAAAAPVKKP
ncbi:MAG: hypothetical protein ABUL71_04390 [Gemmatimonadota bacterium]